MTDSKSPLSLYQFPNRGFITLKGKDVASFLQGLITSDVADIQARIEKSDDQKTPLNWGAYLTPQGKFLFRYFLYGFRQEPHFIIECQGGNELMDFGRRLRQFVLKQDVRLGIDHNLSACNLFSTKTHAITIKEATAFLNEHGVSDIFAIASDPRHSSLGVRMLLKTNIIENSVKNDKESPFSQSAQQIAKQEYERMRISNAIPEEKDLISGKSLILENNFDELNGVSWHKGCFMGQELTARMKHRALIKQKLIALEFSNNAPKRDDVLIHENKQVGMIRSVEPPYCLALLKKDIEIDALKIKDKDTKFKSLKGK